MERKIISRREFLVIRNKVHENIFNKLKYEIEEALVRMLQVGCLIGRSFKIDFKEDADYILDVLNRMKDEIFEPYGKVGWKKLELNYVNRKEFYVNHGGITDTEFEVEIIIS